MHIVDNRYNSIIIAQRFSAEIKMRILIPVFDFHIHTHTCIRATKHYSHEATIIPFAASSRYLCRDTFDPFAALVDHCIVAREDSKEIARNLFSSFMLQRLFFKVPFHAKHEARFIATLLSLGQRMYIHTGFIIIRIPSTIRSRVSRTDSFVNDRFLYHETREFRSRDIFLPLCRFLLVYSCCIESRFHGYCRYLSIYHR